MSDTPIKLILIEDNPEYREALDFGINRMDDISLVAQFGTAEHALRSLQNDVSLSLADVLLLDLHLPKLSGIEAIDWIHTYVPNIKILVLTQSNDRDDVIDALSRGADGYLLKSSSMQQLRDGVLQVFEGGRPLDPQVTGFVLEGIDRKKKQLAKDVHPTVRELEVLECLGKGMIKKEIADALGISTHTVITHVRRVYEKLDVINAPSAVARAYELGILPRS